MKTEVETGVMPVKIKKCAGLPAATRSQETGKAQILPLSPQERTIPANTLISDFWPPALWEHTFFTQFVIVCYRSSGKLTQWAYEPLWALTCWWPRMALGFEMLLMELLKWFKNPHTLTFKLLPFQLLFHTWCLLTILL